METKKTTKKQWIEVDVPELGLVRAKTPLPNKNENLVWNIYYPNSENKQKQDVMVKKQQQVVVRKPKKSVESGKKVNKPEELTDANFDDKINSFDSVIVMFYAPWCPHCRERKPHFIRWGNETGSQKGIQCFLLNTEKHQRKSQEYQIQGIPTFYQKKGAGKSLVKINPTDF